MLSLLVHIRIRTSSIVKTKIILNFLRIFPQASCSQICAQEDYSRGPSQRDGMSDCSQKHHKTRRQNRITITMCPSMPKDANTRLSLWLTGAKRHSSRPSHARSLLKKTAKMLICMSDHFCGSMRGSVSCTVSYLRQRRLHNNHSNILRYMNVEL